MAVPFYVPEQQQDEGSRGGGSNNGGGGSSNQSPNTTSSATQTPLSSPVSGEHLVQAFCEALYRCSFNGSPGFQFPPPSPSCSTSSPNSYSNYSGGEVFFPRGRSTPRSPRISSATTIATTPSSAINNHNNSYNNYSATSANIMMMNIESSSSASSSSSNAVFFRHPPPRNSFDAMRRSRLTSTGDDYYDDECQSEHETSWDELDDRYENYMAARDRLQEFPGRIPPRKKKKDLQRPRQKTKEQSLTWPAVVTVFVFAVGCGFLVSR